MRAQAGIVTHRTVVRQDDSWQWSPGEQMGGDRSAAWRSLTDDLARRGSGFRSPAGTGSGSGSGGAIESRVVRVQLELLFGALPGNQRRRSRRGRSFLGHELRRRRANVFTRDVTVLAVLQLHLYVAKRRPDHFHDRIFRELLIGTVSLLRAVVIERRLVGNDRIPLADCARRAGANFLRPSRSRRRVRAGRKTAARARADDDLFVAVDETYSCGRGLFQSHPDEILAAVLNS